MAKNKTNYWEKFNGKKIETSEDFLKIYRNTPYSDSLRMKELGINWGVWVKVEGLLHKIKNFEDRPLSSSHRDEGERKMDFVNTVLINKNWISENKYDLRKNNLELISTYQIKIDPQSIENLNEWESAHYERDLNNLYNFYYSGLTDPEEIRRGRRYLAGMQLKGMNKNNL